MILVKHEGYEWEGSYAYSLIVGGFLLLYVAIISLKGPKSLKLLYSIMNLNAISAVCLCESLERERERKRGRRAPCCL